MKKGNLGFTLVELIIVIAILAILSTGAIAGYSVYVKQANMTADKALVAEIENLLTLAMYNGELTDSTASGILVLNKDGITYNGEAITSGSDIDTVLKNAYGENYADALKLKYDGWNGANVLNGLDSQTANGIKNSSYIAGNRADKLLSDVESFTSMAANLSNAITGGSESGLTLSSLYGNDLLTQTAQKYGISAPADGDWDAWGTENPQAFSNLLVLATALDTQNAMNNNGQPSAATNLIIDFSRYYGFAATSSEFSKKLDEHMKSLNSVKNPNDGKEWFDQLRNSAEQCKDDNGNDFSNYMSNAKNGDELAFATILAALNNASAEDVASDINNSTMFTNGAVKDIYDQYLSAVKIVSSSNASLNMTTGDVAVIYDQNGYTVYTTITG